MIVKLNLSSRQLEKIKIHKESICLGSLSLKFQSIQLKAVPLLKTKLDEYELFITIERG
jgi:hypothetical protein